MKKSSAEPPSGKANDDLFPTVSTHVATPCKEISCYVAQKLNVREGCRSRFLQGPQGAVASVILPDVIIVTGPSGAAQAPWSPLGLGVISRPVTDAVRL